MIVMIARPYRTSTGTGTVYTSCLLVYSMNANVPENREYTAINQSSRRETAGRVAVCSRS